MAFTQADLDNFRAKALLVGTPAFIGKAEKINFNLVGDTAIPLNVTAPVRIAGILLKNITGRPSQFKASIWSGPNATGTLMFKDLHMSFNYNGGPEASNFTNVDGRFADTKTAYVRVTNDNMFGAVTADLYLFGIYSPV